MWLGPLENFTEINVISAKLKQGAACKPKNVLNGQVASASPQTPLGELIALSKTSYLVGRGTSPVQEPLPLWTLRASLFGHLGLGLWLLDLRHFCRPPQCCRWIGAYAMLIMLEICSYHQPRAVVLLLKCIVDTSHCSDIFINSNSSTTVCCHYRDISHSATAAFKYI